LACPEFFKGKNLIFYSLRYNCQTQSLDNFNSVILAKAMFEKHVLLIFSSIAYGQDSKIKKNNKKKSWHELAFFNSRKFVFIFYFCIYFEFNNKFIKTIRT